MDKQTKQAIKKMRDMQKQRAGLLKKIATQEQMMTKIGWDLAVLRAEDNDTAIKIASESLNNAIRNLHEAMNALGRVDTGSIDSASSVRAVPVAKVEKSSAS